MTATVPVLPLAELLDPALAEPGPDGLPAQPLVLVDLDRVDWTDPPPPPRADLGFVAVGVATETLPRSAGPVLRRLTCTLGDAPGRYGAGDPAEAAAVAATVAAAPRAALTLVGLLGLTARVAPRRGLLAESLAYSMLLGGPEFATWRRSRPVRAVPPATDPVLVGRSGNTLSVTLNRPERHNAFGAAVRDGLLGALELARLDPTIGRVVVGGAGRSYCSGGDLDEFGTAPDPAAAHLIRLRTSCARAVLDLDAPVEFRLHGACVGAGIEIPAFAPTVLARDDAFFQLPELGLGLIPGAGGTVGITRRIGRWRTAYLALTGTRLDLARALDWGLVDGRW